MPTKTNRNGEEIYFSKIQNGPVLSLKYNDAKSLSVKKGTILIPTTFIARCREYVMGQISSIQKWFNPSPSVETLEKVIQFTNSVSYSLDENTDIEIQMDGLILENSRILPNYTITKTTTPIIPDLTKGLVHPENTIEKTDELEEVDISIPIDQDNETTSGESEDESEDESDYDDDERFQIIQRSLDNAREELERLRKRKNQRRH